MLANGFSEEIPGLCLVWDMSRLSQYARDPWTFFFKSYHGYRTAGFNIKTEWGSYYHDSIRLLERRLMAGANEDAAMAEVIKKLVPAALKAGFAVGLTFKAGEHGGPVSSPAKGENGRRSVYTLVRAVIWWLEEYRERPMKPIMLASGEPAHEYNFVLPLDMKAPTGEDYLLCGNIDKIAEDEHGQFSVERKTTTQTLGPYFMSKYDPCFQTYTYDLVCSILFPYARLRGVVVEACQTAQEFTRFERYPILRSPGARDHWLKVIKHWIKRAEQDAIDNSWSCAMNTESSSYDSVYREIQRRDPKMWPAMLEMELTKEEPWNPLVPKASLLGD